MSESRSVSNITTESNSSSISNGSLIFGMDVNDQKPISSNKTNLTIGITDYIILEGLSFNLAQEPWFKKVVDLARNVSKTYTPSKRKLVSK